jgi:NAD(P)H-dependent flavin oxidoreductase YrpB (nitropropane dioxygenase family)
MTPVCSLLGIDVPIFAAPMGPAITSPELAAAVSNAGGLGLISFGGYPPELAPCFDSSRTRTHQPAFWHKHDSGISSRRQRGCVLVLLDWTFNDTILQKENAPVFGRLFAAKPRCATRSRM